MRKLFHFASMVTSGAQEEKAERSLPDRRTQSMRTKRSSVEFISPVVLCAATALSDAIQVIANSLTGDNISGFQRLIEVLESTDTHREVPSLVSKSNGVGCLQILIDNVDHSKFADICNQTALTTSLMHALRMLRMYEMKLGKLECQNKENNFDEDKEKEAMDSVPGEGVTTLSAKRICIVFETLCADSQTVEKLRPNLLKFLTYPLNTFPKRGVHLQTYFSRVMSQLCKVGFNSQQVWYLHDQQVILRLVQQFSELTGITDKQLKIGGPSAHSVDFSSSSTSMNASSLLGSLGGPNELLRGSRAEQTGMWLTALTCLVDFITHSVATSNVLLVDFEQIGGYGLLTNILANTSPERQMDSINIITRLFFDPSKGVDEPICFPAVGVVFSHLLFRSLDLSKGIGLEDGIERMIEIGKELAVKRDQISQHELFLQNLSYALLTLYSNEPKNCNILEDSYHFLPNLLIALPALSQSDAVSAVLTAFNYVCQCVENAATLAIIAICASSTVIVVDALRKQSSDEVRKLAAIHLDSMHSSFEAMMRGNAKYALTLVHCGLLKHLVSGPFEDLRCSCNNAVIVGPDGSTRVTSFAIDENIEVIFKKLIDIIISINKKSPQVADEIRRVGLQIIFRDLVKSPCVSQAFTKSLLALVCELAKRDSFNLEESLILLTTLVQVPDLSFSKVARVLEGITTVLIAVDNAAFIWMKMDGFSYVLEVLVRLSGKFLSPPGELMNPTSSIEIDPLVEYLDCFQAVLHCLAIDVTITAVEKYEEMYDQFFVQFKRNYRKVAVAIRNTGIFQSPNGLECINLLFCLVRGFSKVPLIVNAHAVLVVMDILPYLNESLAEVTLRTLWEHSNARIDGKQKLCETRVLRSMMDSYHEAERLDKQVIAYSMYSLIQEIMSSYLTLENFESFIVSFLRVDVLSNFELNRLLPPWLAHSEEISKRDWKNMKFLKSFIDEQRNAVPFITLGTFISTHLIEPAYLQVAVNDLSTPFPPTGFAYSGWVQLAVNKEEQGVPSMVIPVLSLTSMQMNGCFFEAHLDIEYCFVRICVRRNSKTTTLRFKPSFTLSKDAWHHIAITVKKPKRFGASKSVVCVYFNGTPGVPVNTDLVEIDLPSTTAGQLVELVVGRYLMEIDYSSNDMIGDSELWSKLTVPEEWRLGPIHFFEEPIAPIQVASVFLKGPNYTGNFQADAPLQDSLATASCELLYKCNRTNLSADYYFEQLGLKGMEYVTGMNSEFSSTLATTIESMAVPPPLFCYSAQRKAWVQHANIKDTDGNCIHDEWAQSRISLLNVAEAFEQTPEASVVHGHFVNTGESVSACVSALGGPVILLPILQAASTSQQLCQFLYVLKAAIESAGSNLRYMQYEGYQIVAFILSIKSKDVLTVEVLDALFELLSDKTESESAMVNNSVLLLDCTAILHIFMNSQLWDFANRTIPVKILSLLRHSVTDITYGELNARRLSTSVPLVRWILFTCVFAADLAGKNVVLRETSEIHWKFNSCSASDASIGLRSNDEFLAAAVTVLHQLIRVDVRKKDLELVANVILHTLIQYDVFEEDYEEKMNSSGMLRLYLQEFLLNFYDCMTSKIILRTEKKSTFFSSEGSVTQVFREAISAEWCLTVLDKIKDTATCIYHLRLIVLMIQRDSTFQHEFSALDGMALITTQLTSRPQPSAVMLPLLALLFQIPMGSVPFTVRHTVDILVLLFSDDCLGADVSEPGINEVTLPAYGLLMDLFVMIVRARPSSESPDSVCETVREVFRQSMDNNENFRRLMQHRSAISILTSAALNCSNAVDEYGTHIFMRSQDSMDLGSILQEDYIGPAGELSPRTPTRDDQDEYAFDFVATDDKYRDNCGCDDDHMVGESRELKLLEPEGVFFVSMISSTLKYAITELDNSSVLAALALSFPQNLVESFVTTFHMLLMERLTSFIHQLTSDLFDLQQMQTISNILTNLVPLIRARALEDCVQVELLKLSVFLLKKLSAIPRPNVALQAVIKDMGTTCRFLAISCVQAVNVERKNREELRLTLLSSVRLNLHLFLSASISDDISDFTLSAAPSRFRREQSLMEEKGTGTAVLEAFQMSWGLDNSKKNNDSAQLTIAQSDKQRLSQAFCISMVCHCCNLVFDENNAIRLESMRIFALLTMKRRALIEQLLSNAATNKISLRKLSYDNMLGGDDVMIKGPKGNSFFTEGLDKLVPPSHAEYERFLSGAINECDGEQHRIADFSYWFADHNTLCSRILAPIEAYLTSITPSAADVEEIVRQIQLSRVKEDTKADNASRVKTIMKRAEDGQRTGEQVVFQVRKWKARGFRQLAAGAFLWKRSWYVLQSSSLWGFQMQQVDAQVGTSRPKWTLNMIEGPERSRKRLEQDFDADSEALLKYEVDHVADAALVTVSTCEEKIIISSHVVLTSEETSLDVTETMTTEEDLENSPSHELGRPNSSSTIVSNTGIAYERKLSSVSGDGFSPNPNSLRRASTFRTVGSLPTMMSFVENISKQGLKINKVKGDEAAEEGFDFDDQEGDDDDNEDSSVSSDNEEVISTGLDAVQLDKPSSQARSKSFNDVYRTRGLSEAASPGSKDPTEDQDDFEPENSLDLQQSYSTASLAALDIPEPNDTTLNPMSAPATSPQRVGRGTIERDSPRRWSIARSEYDIQSTKRSQSALEMVKGLIGSSEWIVGKALNVQKIQGLETQPSLFILTPTTIHLLSGFRVRTSSKPFRKSIANSNSAASSINTTPGRPIGQETHVDWISPTSIPIGNVEWQIPNGATAPAVDENKCFDDAHWVSNIWTEMLGPDFDYVRISLADIYTIFKRKHQLKHTALEVTDTKGISLLFSCDNAHECNDILMKLFEAELPSSIFNRVIGLKNLEMLRGLSGMYNRMLSHYISSITKQWQHGQLSNFEYLIHLNSAAGRSFQDLTQYPVFPWVLADYTSDVLVLDRASTYRDLSKPMGALGSKRVRQYQERFKTMDEFKRSGVEGTPPPFHYGTHYSCAGYVLNYLIRLQPYSNMAVALQGGHVDHADRLFSSILSCWKSASEENLQDVRELIPEFYYLPEFFMNSNGFSLGTTQKGEKVHDVELPPWAKGDAREFVRLHREALESRYVSENLHNWIDLIFGYKQRGTAAENAMNVFIHLTYEGEVDVDAITDPVLRSATIDQINNFGQTPTKLFNKPHPRRIVPDLVKRSNDGIMIDSHGVSWHEHASPPLCIVGAHEFVKLAKQSFVQVPLTSSRGVASIGSGIGDMRLLARDRPVVVARGCVIVPPLCKRMVKLGGPAGSVSFHAILNQHQQLGHRFENNKELVTTHEHLHERTITCASFSRKGELMVTGSEDCSVRLWNMTKLDKTKKIEHMWTYFGHAGPINCVEVCPEFQVVVSGSVDCTTRLWDIVTGTMLRVLCGHLNPIISVAISHVSGCVTTLTSAQLRLFSINGDLISSVAYSAAKMDIEMEEEIDRESSGAAQQDSHTMGHYTTGSSTTNTTWPIGKVVVAPPCADWQDGVVAVTGHRDGYVLLWKLKNVPVTNKSAIPSTPSTSNFSTGSESGQSSPSKNTSKLSVVTSPTPVLKMLVAYPLSKGHRSDIVALRLASFATGKSKDLVDRCFEDAGNFELIVADSEGYISRWATPKLDTLNSYELSSILSPSAREIRSEVRSPVRSLSTISSSMS